MKNKPIQISEIRIDGDTQQRVSIDLDVVEEYAEAMRCGAKFPPVSIFHDGAQFWLADGFHRYHASTKAEMLDILAEIHPGTQRDAVLFSFGANAQHGVRPTNSDKRKSVLRMLGDKEWTKWSDRDIATRCNVSHTFVSKLRKESSAKSGTTAKPSKSTVRSGNVATSETESDKAPAEPAYDPTQDRIAELAHTVTDLAQENDRLRDAIAVGNMDSSLIDGVDALETLATLRQRVVDLEREVDTLRGSRDDYQMQVAELKRQCAMQRREIEKLKKA